MSGRNYPVPRTTQAPIDARPKFARLFFHAATAAVMLHSFITLGDLDQASFFTSRHGSWSEYLTIVGVVCTGVTMAIAALRDLLPAVKALSTLKRALLLITMPLESVITAIYWPLLIFAQDLILSRPPNQPGVGEPSAFADQDLALFRLPLHKDLVMHAVPAVVLLIDFLLLEPKYTPPASTIGAIALVVAVGGTYTSWIEHCAKLSNGQFPYPFLTIMPLWGRVLFYVGGVGWCLLVFTMLNKIKRPRGTAP